MTYLLLRRGKGWHDMFRAYRVFVDGIEVGTINQGAELTVSVAPGKRTVQFKIDWCSSEPLRLAISEGKTEVVECGPNAKPLLELIYITFLRGQYIWSRHIAAGP